MKKKMSFFKYLLSFVLLMGLLKSSDVMSVEADESRFEEELNERDFDALRDFLKKRRAVDAAPKVSNLTFSGDVRTEWRHMNESCRGTRLRGHDRVNLRGIPVSRNDFDIEFNLRLDYVNDCTWAVAHVRYDNSAGVDDNGHPCNYTPRKEDFEEENRCLREARICQADPEGFHGSGNCEDLCLKKAYMGYELYSNDCSRFIVELGRRGNLYNVFESNVQFLSRFDGLLFKYQSSLESVSDWYIQAAGFVVDEKVNHFAWIAEVGFLNIYDTNINLKYSFVDWEKHGRNRCFVHNPRGFRFMNSQWTLSYNLSPDALSVPVKFYGAFLWNHAAHNYRIEQKNLGRQNLAWYAGVLVGEVKKEGDWALEVQYQYVQAQSIPDDDVSGIARGNVLDESFTSCARSGNTNFKGWRIEGLYAVTDNITLDTIVEWSKAVNSKIGGRHSYSKFELEAIYAF